MLRYATCVLMALSAWSNAHASGFDVVVLGARGGIEDGNLSAYLVMPSGDPRGVLCDAGSVVRGLEATDASGNLPVVAGIHKATEPESRIGDVVHDVIRGYLISHAHMDHIAGLVAVSPDDTAKPIYALPSVSDVLSRDVFNWEVWPNLTDRGREPRIGKYHFHDLTVGVRTQISGTAMQVLAYPLSHGGVQSTAFLIHAGNDALLYLGDTGADAVEHSDDLHRLWEAVAQDVRNHRLRGIIIECSYDDARPDKLLFGHLSPHWLKHELGSLASISGGDTVLSGMTVVVSHIKYDMADPKSAKERILAQLRAQNTIGVNFVLPEQGQLLKLR